MPTLLARIALPLALLASACGGDPAPPASSPGEALIARGDVLCEQLFKANAAYLASTEPSVDGLLQVGARVMPAFKTLEPPTGDERWTRPLALRWAAVVAARGTGEELVAPLWEFIGAARVGGVWTCGAEQAALLVKAPRPTGAAAIPPEDYAARVMKVIDSTAADHEEYHHDPDPAELQKRIQPGVGDSHGPGYLAIQDRIVNGVAAVPPPRGQLDEAAAFLLFLREARAAEAKGIQIGGPAGDAAYELGFFWTSQAIGVACVVWALDLC